MAKCLRCGKSTIVRGHVALSDGAICTPCFKKLGFKLSDTATASIYHYADIKDGRDAYYEKAIKESAEQYDRDQADKYGLSVGHYLQLEKAGATDNEMKIFSAICAILNDEGIETDPILIAPGDNGSLLLLIDGVIMLQYKSEPNVKWILFPNESEEKIRIGGVARMNSMAPRIVAAYEAATA